MKIILVAVMLVQMLAIPPCLFIKPYVTLYGVEAVIEWAKQKGYTQAEINAFRKKCSI